VGRAAQFRLNSTLSTLLVAARFAAINNDMMSFTLKSQGSHLRIYVLSD